MFCWLSWVSGTVKGMKAIWPQVSCGWGMSLGSAAWRGFWSQTVPPYCCRALALPRSTAANSPYPQLCTAVAGGGRKCYRKDAALQALNSHVKSRANEFSLVNINLSRRISSGFVPSWEVQKRAETWSHSSKWKADTYCAVLVPVCKLV